jgi:hypothetical protein
LSAAVQLASISRSAAKRTVSGENEGRICVIGRDRRPVHAWVSPSIARAVPSPITSISSPASHSHAPRRARRRRPDRDRGARHAACSSRCSPTSTRKLVPPRPLDLWGAEERRADRPSATAEPLPRGGRGDRLCRRRKGWASRATCDPTTALDRRPRRGACPREHPPPRYAGPVTRRAREEGRDRRAQRLGAPLRGAAGRRRRGARADSFL